MKRPTVKELLAMIANTVHLQFANSADGQRLSALDAAAVAGMEDRIASNVAATVAGMLDELLGEA